MDSNTVDASGVQESASARKNYQIQVRPSLDGLEIVVVAYGHSHSTWALLTILHAMFKLKCDFVRRLEAKAGRARVPQPLLDERRINDLLLVFTCILRVSLRTFPTQSFSVEATE